MLRKTMFTLALVLLGVFATEVELRHTASGAMKVTSASENSAVHEIGSPAGTGSVDPSLSAGRDGRVYLSWLEPIQPAGYALKFAARSKDGKWSTPLTITQGENRFESSILALPDGSLAAYWLAKSGPERHANDVKLSISRDGGRTWGKEIVAHQDRTQAERGFVSIVPANGGVGVVWLKGMMMMGGNSDAARRDSTDSSGTDTSRHPTGHKHTGSDQERGKHDMTAMTASKMESAMMYSTVSLDGTLGKEVLLDARVCECCQTAAAPTPDGIAVVYRDRSEQEIRDISIVRLKKEKWSEPEPLSKDGWQINGCPVNGPAISSAGKNVAVAWFTAVRDQPRVFAALSADGGASFGPPILLGDERPIGRVDVIALPSGKAVVSWAERTPSGMQVRVRTVKSDGSKASMIIVTQTASGTPRIQRSGDEVFIAWTDSEDNGKVHTAILRTNGS